MTDTTLALFWEETRFNSGNYGLNKSLRTREHVTDCGSNKAPCLLKVIAIRFDRLYLLFIITQRLEQ